VSPERWPSLQRAKVTAEVLGEGRGNKILVFHLKRKKQYKKLQGHRQNFTEVRIKAIEAERRNLHGGKLRNKLLALSLQLSVFSCEPRAGKLDSRCTN